jgi:hypothetical protein
MIPVESWARGGGGGGGRGGSRGGGGGGFSGGASRGGGGFSGGSRPSPSPSFGGGSRPSPTHSFSGGGRPSPSPSFGAGGGTRPGAGIGAGGTAGLGGGTRPGAGIGAGGTAGLGGGSRPGAGIGAAGSAGVGGGARPGAGVSGGAGNAAAAGRFNAPSQSQLGSFLGLPSDEGLGHAASAAPNRGAISNASTLPAAGSNFDVNYGTKEGPRGGQAAGVAVTGPQGNTAGKAAAVGPQGGAATVGGVKGADGGVAARGAAVGPNGGAAVAGGVQGPNGGTAARGAAVGPNGQVVAGRGAVGPGGYGGGGVVTAGPAGVGAGFTRVTPSGRYTAAAAVRGDYNNWGVYNRGWYANYPGAWFAAGWAANALWTPATWGTTAAYCGYVETPPVYYDYGNNVVYEDSVVYVNGESAGTTEEYYDQAMAIATEGTEAEAAPDGDWMPLGVFAFTKADNPKSDITIQLAVNKEGVIRGNYTDTATKQNQVIQGSIDKETQRAAFTVGDNKTSVIETGIYNLTKDEAPCLVHIGKEKTEQWLLVRLTNPEAAAG